jgi:tetratricopeptide (TPR) repeat protein
MWARHFDIKSNALNLQDEVVSNIVCAVSSSLELTEIERIKGYPPDSRNLAQRYLHGLGHLYLWNRDGVETALRVFQEAITADPGFGPAYGMAAYCYVQRKSYGWVVDRAIERAECERLALNAAEFGSEDAFTLAKAAHAISAVIGDLDAAAILIERSLNKNPKLIAAWYVSGWINLFLGRIDSAKEHLVAAIKLNPSDPLVFKSRAALAYAHLLDGSYDESSKQALRAIAVRPGYLTAMRGAAASLALAGRRDDARRLIRAMQEQNPLIRLSNLPDLLPFQRKRDIALWADGLQRAGLPD